eukprot:2129974-Rhodomonas_salina.1
MTCATTSAPSGPGGSNIARGTCPRSMCWPTACRSRGSGGTRTQGGPQSPPRAARRQGCRTRARRRGRRRPPA